MRDATTTASGGYQKWLIGFILISMIACGVVSLVGYNLLKSWGAYDPEPNAEATVRRCLDQEADACGYITASLCLEEMHRSASRSGNAYEIEVMWYNQEDEICCRGGDEVYLQVNFINRDRYNLLWYEGTLEQCEIPGSHTNNPP
jgi:hypothetical protein